MNTSGSAGVWQLIRLFVDVAFHKRGPADFPDTQPLFRTALGAYLLVGFIALQLDNDWLRALHMALVEVLVLLGFVWVILRMFGEVKRFFPTATPMLGAHALLGVLQIPLLWYAGGVEELSGPLIVAALVLVFWSIDIGAWLLSRSLGQPYVFGLFLMIVYLLGVMSMHEYLFPTAS
jgi:hypothetical protein